VSVRSEHDQLIEVLALTYEYGIGAIMSCAGLFSLDRTAGAKLRFVAQARTNARSVF